MSTEKNNKKPVIPLLQNPRKIQKWEIDRR